MKRNASGQASAVFVPQCWTGDSALNSEVHTVDSMNPTQKGVRKSGVHSKETLTVHEKGQKVETIERRTIFRNTQSGQLAACPDLGSIGH